MRDIHLFFDAISGERVERQFHRKPLGRRVKRGAIRLPGALDIISTQMESTVLVIAIYLKQQSLVSGSIGKYQFAAGCAVPPEVAEVSIPTEFDLNVRPGPGGEIAGHDGGRAAQKGERSSTHPTVGSH